MKLDYEIMGNANDMITVKIIKNQEQAPNLEK